MHSFGIWFLPKTNLSVKSVTEDFGIFKLFLFLEKRTQELDREKKQEFRFSFWPKQNSPYKKEKDYQLPLLAEMGWNWEQQGLTLNPNEELNFLCLSFLN